MHPILHGRWARRRFFLDRDVPGAQGIGKEWLAYLAYIQKRSMPKRKA